jgi:hypothetical protein
LGRCKILTPATCVWGLRCTAGLQAQLTPTFEIIYLVTFCVQYAACLSQAHTYMYKG